MTAFVALLRGINVGGKNILPMQAFRELLTELGCIDVARENPFAVEASDPKFLHVWFMREPATSANTTRMGELESAGEKFLLTDSAVCLYAPDGIGRSKLAGGMEKCLGVPATARNWRTVGKLGEMLSVHSLHP